MIFTSHLFVVPLFLSWGLWGVTWTWLCSFQLIEANTTCRGTTRAVCVHSHERLSGAHPDLIQVMDVTQAAEHPDESWSPPSHVSTSFVADKSGKDKQKNRKLASLLLSSIFYPFLYLSLYLFPYTVQGDPSLFQSTGRWGSARAALIFRGWRRTTCSPSLSLSLFLTVQRRLPFVFFSKDIGHVVTWRKHPALFTRRLVCFHQRPSKMFACFYFSSWRQSLDTVSARPMAHQCLATCVSTPALPSTIVLVVYFRDIL